MKTPRAVPADRERKFALMFPGQGSQHTGMGRDIVNRSAKARQVLDEADHMWRFKVSRIVTEGTEKDLSRTTTTQPAILAVSWAHLAYLRERAMELGKSFRPALVSGHSFGQFTAA